MPSFKRQFENVSKQKQEILKMIQRDPEENQLENFKIELKFEIKHKNSKGPGERTETFFATNSGVMSGI